MVGRVCRERQVDVGAIAGGVVERQSKLGRHDADDGRRIARDLDLFADDGRIAAESPLPELVTDQRDSRTADAVFVRGEVAALRWADAEDREDVGMHVRAADALGRIAVDRRRRLRIERDVGERGDSRFPPFPLVIREPGLVEALPCAPHGDDALGLPVRQRREQDLLHDAEHRGGGADAECERERRGSGESRALA